MNILGLLFALVAEMFGIKGVQFRQSKKIGNLRINASHRGVSFGLSRKRKK